jgi:hypothetical protein
MNEEFTALMKNGTWDKDLVPSQPSRNLVDCKWIFKVKCHSDGSVECYKAQLVAKGFSQRYGLDYAETFNPVINPTTVRLILSIAVPRGWSIHQADVKNAFLNGELQETVYMWQPLGFVNPSPHHHVCHLRKVPKKHGYVWHPPYPVSDTYQIWICVGYTWDTYPRLLFLIRYFVTPIRVSICMGWLWIRPIRRRRSDEPRVGSMRRGAAAQERRVDHREHLHTTQLSSWQPRPRARGGGTPRGGPEQGRGHSGDSGGSRPLKQLPQRASQRPPGGAWARDLGQLVAALDQGWVGLWRGWRSMQPHSEDEAAEWGWSSRRDEDKVDALPVD